MYRLSRLSLLCAALLLGCAVNPVTGKKDFMLISEEAEIRMGQESDPAIVASFGLYEDEGLAKLLDVKGKEMAAISHRPHLKYEFKVLDSPVVNAFAVPGGYVYFTRGILAHFNNEAEFAGVLGHEIGHITARHSAKQLSNQQLFQAGFIAGLIISPEFAQFADLTQQAVGLMFLKFSRDNESQSDYLGVEYSTEVGYDAREMAGFFKTIGRLSGEGGTLPSFLSTHPDPGDREQNVMDLAGQQQSLEPDKTYLINRDKYLDLIDGLVYGDDPRKGFIEGSTYYHPNHRYSFELPAQWETNVSPNRVLAAHESGEALIVTGVVDDATSLEEALSESVESLNLTVTSKQAKNVNDIRALEVEAVQKNPQDPTATYPFSIVFYEHDGRIIRALAVSTQAARDDLGAVLKESIGSLKVLRDVSKLKAEPETLQIVRLADTKTLSEALTAYNMPEDRHEELAVLNGLELNDLVDAGSRIKIVRFPASS